MLKRTAISAIVLLIAILTACGGTQPSSQIKPDTEEIARGRFPDRLSALAITNLFQETSLSGWGKKANVTLSDLNGFTKVGITDTNTGWTSRVVPNSSAADTYTGIATLL